MSKRKSEGTLTIGQVAQLAGVGVETVRFYERQGLVEDPPRTKSGYRQYSSGVIDRIRFIKQSRALGFSLKETKELLNLRLKTKSTRGEVKKRAEAKMAEINEKIQSLKRMEDALRKLVAACSGNGPAIESPILDALEPQGK